MPGLLQPVGLSPQATARTKLGRSVYITLARHFLSRSVHGLLAIQVWRTCADMTFDRGQYRLVTSRDLGSRRSTGSDHARKKVDISAGEVLRLCQIEGAGRIVRFWATLPVTGRGSVLKSAVLRMYWDGEETPSVEAPLGDFFGATFGKPRHLVSERLIVAGGAYLSRFEMPFNTGAVIEIWNDSTQPLRDLFFQIGYYVEAARAAREPTLHAQFRREAPTAPGKPCSVLRARGTGWLAGLRIDIQNRAWWLKLPLREMFLPRGFGLGILEGWETITIDDDQGSSLVGTGMEDYFSGGFYFKGAPFCTPTHGCTEVSFLVGRVSGYRFHVDDPIHFQKSIDVTFDHGFGNSMTADYCSVAYWYQYEPHEPHPPLPPGHARHLDFPWTNPSQWALCIIVLPLVAGAITYAIRALL